MSEANIPSDIGKKIAQALQAEEDVDFVRQEEISEIVNEQPIDEIMPEEEISYAQTEDVNNEIYESSSFALEFDKPNFNDIIKEPPRYESVYKHADAFSQEESAPELKLSIDLEQDEEEFEMPNNINVLKRLIAQLPTGVPKQTGAQIIRQTIEALGIPMKSVLQDAQKVRDCLNSSIKDCAFTIQEYRSNIRNLEKQSAGYQKQLAKLNDIISLFVYNDKR